MLKQFNSQILMNLHVFASELFLYLFAGNLTKSELHSSSTFQEGTLIEFNCTATLDESHAKIKGYYKKQSDSSFIEIEGSTTLLEKNLSYCSVDVIWKPANLFTADASFNDAQIKCEISDWPLAKVMTQITVNKAGKFLSKNIPHIVHIT